MPVPRRGSTSGAGGAWRVGVVVGAEEGHDDVQDDKLQQQQQQQPAPAPALGVRLVGPSGSALHGAPHGRQVRGALRSVCPLTRVRARWRVAPVAPP